MPTCNGGQMHHSADHESSKHWKLRRPGPHWTLKQGSKAVMKCPRIKMIVLPTVKNNNNNTVFKNILGTPRYYSQRENLRGLGAIESRYDLSQGDGRLMEKLLQGKNAKKSPMGSYTLEVETPVTDVWRHCLARSCRVGHWLNGSEQHTWATPRSSCFVELHSRVRIHRKHGKPCLLQDWATAWAWKRQAAAWIHVDIFTSFHAS